MAAWDRLVRLHQETVFRLAYLMLGDDAEAEDVAQETMIRAYLKLERFDMHRPLRPWLMSIAANLARNRRRSISRYRAALRRFWQNEPATTKPASEIEVQTDSYCLWQAVRKLRPKAQEIIYLRYFMELSESETAATLNIAPGTVKSRLHRALKHLRRIIEDEYPEVWTAWSE